VAWLLALTVLAVARTATAVPPPDFGANNPFVIVAFGDSVTAGVLGDPPRGPAARPYPAGLQLSLNARRPGFTVLNRGRGGEGTDASVDRIPSVLAADRPGFVLIMEGTNDAIAGATAGSIVANLREMVRLAKASRTVPLLGAILPHMSDPAAQAIVQSVNAQLPAVAAEEGARFVDTFAAMNDAGLFGADGFHPNQTGYDTLAAAWLPAVLDAIEPSLFRSLAGIDDPPDTASPDATIAAGPGRLVLARRSVTAIRTKAGALIASSTLAGFFAPVLLPGEVLLSEPHVTFDVASNRFFLVAGARADDPTCTPGTCVAHLLLAISRSADPVSFGPGDWHLYALDRTLDRTPAGATVTATWGDRDRVAVVGAVVAVAFRARRFGDGVAEGGKVRLLPRAPLVAGQPVTTWTDLVDFDAGTATGLLPAMTFGDPGTVFLVSRADCGFTIHGIADPLGTPARVTRVVATAAPACGAPPPASQPGGPSLEVAAAGLATQPVYRNGSLWVADTVGVPLPGGAVAAIRWLQVDVATWPDEVAVLQDALFGDEGVFHFAPAIAVDPSGNLSIVYARSSATQFVSVYVTGRRTPDPGNTLRPGLPVMAGVAPVQLVDALGQTRVADALGAAIDPTDGSAWLVGLFAETASRIGTRAVQLGFAAAPLLTATLDGDRFRAGATLRLTATLTPGGLPFLVDAYVVVRLPNGSFLSLREDGTLIPGVIPIVARVQPFAFAGELFRAVLSGGEPPGSYAWLAALTHPGTLSVIGAADRDPFRIE
jgi:lysophospholipase L1-like esterase